MLDNLLQKIEQKKANLAVIGLGYVGLPLACEFARVGFDVLGVEIISERVEQINAGQSPIEGNEPGLAELLNSVVGQKQLRATTAYDDLRDRDVVFINVETPVDDRNIPQYTALRAVLTHLGPALKQGALVIVESTIAPGTMHDLVLPMLEEKNDSVLNQGFFLGNCPERVMPGKLLANLRNVSRVVGGMTPETADVMVALYRHIVHADLDPTDCVTAELVKTVENAYRDVQIAFANEVALICESVGGDVWHVRDLVNKSPGRQMHLPGAGVGGHCIPKDPWLLASAVKNTNVPIQLISAARGINDTMPMHIAVLLQDALEEEGQDLAKSRILVLGYAYLEDSDDTRNSPSAILIKHLQSLGANTIIHDPFVPEYNGDLLELAKDCDAAVLMVRHQAYIDIDLLALKAKLKSPVFIDGRHVFSSTDLSSLGFTNRVIGQSADHSKAS